MLMISGKAGVTQLSTKFEPKMLTFVMLIEKKSSQYQETISYIKPFLLNNCRTYNMNDNPKNNNLMSENIR